MWLANDKHAQCRVRQVVVPLLQGHVEAMCWHRGDFCLCQRSVVHSAIAKSTASRFVAAKA